MKTPESTLVTLPIEDVRPYPGNPRIITEADVNRVRASIERYGYQAPIIVDPDNVVIVGHTRLEALRQMGETEVRVIRSHMAPEKAAEYRIIDNRAAELATWDRDLLIPELREFIDPAHLELFFPEIDLSLDFSDENMLIDDEDLAKAQEALDKKLRDNRKLVHKTIECPECQFHIQVST